MLEVKKFLRARKPRTMPINSTIQLLEQHHSEPMSAEQPRLTTIILTHNEEKNLPACLKSIEGLDCELLIVDSGSTDRTLEIATSAAARIIQHPFENYAAQRNFAQSQVKEQSPDWVLHLDADERLTSELVQEINSVLRNVDPHTNGFLLRKRTIFMGRWIRHGGHYPSFHLRLFRLHKGRCEDRLYDQHFMVEGKISSLRNDYLDIVATDLRSWTERHARWAGLEAQELMEPTREGTRVSPKFFGSPIERKRWLREKALYRPPLFLRPFLYFIYRYLFRRGFLDGKEGLIFHFLQGCWYRFLIDATIFEKQRLTSTMRSE